MDQILLSKYAALEDRFRMLEEEREGLRQQILNELIKNNIEKTESEVFGSFTVAHKTVWQYSPAVKKIEERLKIARVKEQDRGVAKSSTSQYLVYKPVK